jgi:hypothetical protein
MYRVSAKSNCLFRIIGYLLNTEDCNTDSWPLPCCAYDAWQIAVLEGCARVTGARMGSWGAGRHNESYRWFGGSGGSLGGQRRLLCGAEAFRRSLGGLSLQASGWFQATERGDRCSGLDSGRSILLQAQAGCGAHPVSCLVASAPNWSGRSGKLISFMFCVKIEKCRSLYLFVLCVLSLLGGHTKGLIWYYGGTSVIRTSLNRNSG